MALMSKSVLAPSKMTLLMSIPIKCLLGEKRHTVNVFSVEITSLDL